MNDWTLFESAMVFTAIFGIPMVMAASVILWNCIKKAAWFISKLIECAIWRAEHIHGIKINKRRTRK